MGFPLRLMMLASAWLAAPSEAQPAPPPGPQIVVEGRRITGGKPEAMSNWHLAETDHVLVYGPGPPDRLARTAHGLEKLHFLLSVLLGRTAEPDDTAKLRVMIFGDAADFLHLGLRDSRWQPGPYPDAFATDLHYEVRLDGAVLVTTRTDQAIALQRSKELLTLDELRPVATGGMENSIAGKVLPGEQPIDGIAFPLTSDSRLYAAFARHYLLTYFPAAYPRWYLEGFGEIFATLSSGEDGTIDYGRPPPGLRDVVEWYGRYPLGKVLDGGYLGRAGRRPSWTPYHAWALAHLLFFSDEWREPLHRYLAAIARGTPEQEAAHEFGHLERLEAALADYRGRSIPFERLRYPADHVLAPTVRQLTRREATVLREGLLLESRLTPPAPPLSPAAAPAGPSDRGRWLAELRRLADEYPGDLDAQLLVAEAQCRSGGSAPCLAAAERALAIAPEDVRALSWKGIALTQQAIAGPARARDAALGAARTSIGRANRKDPEAALPLVAYYRSFADAGLPAPELAVLGLVKASRIVPASPSVRLMLGEALVRRGDLATARTVLLPLVAGAYPSPEAARARELLAPSTP